MEHRHTIELARVPTRRDLIDAPGTSHWLVAQLVQRQDLSNAMGRDPVDALRDAELLVVVLAERLKSLGACYACDGETAVNNHGLCEECARPVSVGERGAW